MSLLATKRTLNVSTRSEQLNAMRMLIVSYHTALRQVFGTGTVC